MRCIHVHVFGFWPLQNICTLRRTHQPQIASTTTSREGSCALSLGLYRSPTRLKTLVPLKRTPFTQGLRAFMLLITKSQAPNSSHRLSQELRNGLSTAVHQWWCSGTSTCQGWTRIFWTWARKDTLLLPMDGLLHIAMF